MGGPKKAMMKKDVKSREATQKGCDGRIIANFINKVNLVHHSHFWAASLDFKLFSSWGCTIFQS